jgi:hypothetical protein
MNYITIAITLLLDFHLTEGLSLELAPSKRAIRSFYQQEAVDAGSQRNTAQSPLPRRRALYQIVGLASSFAFVGIAADASAAPGAAEYDLEYYMRDLVMGNNREGNRPPSPPPASPPPRTLVTHNFLDALLNEACDGNCIAVSQLSLITGLPSTDISRQIDTLRNKVYPSFQVKHPWTQTSLQDEYYFDLTNYCLFRVAADLIPQNYALRDEWVRSMGNNLYARAKELLPTLATTSIPTNNQTLTLSQSSTLLIQIMNLFNYTRYVSSYRIQRDTSFSSDIPIDVFDSYDDEDIQLGRSINLIISLKQPATLGAALQLTAEGSRFTPEFIAPTLAAMWTDLCHLSTDYETYFVDNTYRPNPKDFFPDEVLIQFTIKPQNM